MGDRTLRTTVVEDVGALEPHLSAWDALAVECGRPFCAPAWMLAWWRHGRTGDARLRVVLVHDTPEGTPLRAHPGGHRQAGGQAGVGELVGIGPFYAQIGAFGLNEMRLLGAGFAHRIGPLARAQRKAAVAGALARALTEIEPRPASICLEGVDEAENWSELLATAWPGGRPPRVRTDVRMDGCTIVLDGSMDGWLERRPRHFRKEARRTARRLAEEGVHPRIAEDETALVALERLHRARWAPRGGSSVERHASAVIADAARSLAGKERLKVVLLEGPDGALAAELLVCAGRVGAFWGGGFDPAWARYAPGTQAMLGALEWLAGQGIEVADLGGGGMDYHLRMEEREEPVVWQTILLRGWRHPLLRVRLAPKHLRLALRKVVRRLPPGQQARLRSVRRVLRRS